jgi:hypothetical protein
MKGMILSQLASADGQGGLSLAIYERPQTPDHSRV